MWLYGPGTTSIGGTDIVARMAGSDGVLLTNDDEERVLNPGFSARSDANALQRRGLSLGVDSGLAAYVADDGGASASSTWRGASSGWRPAEPTASFPRPPTTPTNG